MNLVYLIWEIYLVVDDVFLIFFLAVALVI